MLEQVNRRRPAGHAALAKAIGTVSSRMRRGEILIVISDLWEDRGHILDACSRILFRGGEVVLMQLLHDDELNLPPENAAILVDSEQLRSQVHVDLDAVRADYRREVAKHLAQWRADCLQARLDYQLCSASRPYYESLAGYLARRSAAG